MEILSSFRICLQNLKKPIKNVTEPFNWSSAETLFVVLLYIYKTLHIVLLEYEMAFSFWGKTLDFS